MGSRKNNDLRQEDNLFSFGKMEGIDGEKLSLKFIYIYGSINGLLFSYSIRQRYRNETRKPLEIIYTFPVGWGTALLGMQAAIGHKLLTGVVVEKIEAETRYEQAISDGNSAIMLQQSSKGLYTANLGNIKPGETVTIDIKCAKLLNIEQGQIRLAIPTVISERYGDPHISGALNQHESAEVDFNARYPFGLRINIYGDLAKGKVSCPSHPDEVAMKKNEDMLHVALNSGAFQDKDFVLVIKDLTQKSFALCAPDEDKWMALGSFKPQMIGIQSSAIAVKILVDCSGSMNGQRIYQAIKGLEKIFSMLRNDDFVSYTIFGSGVNHIFANLMSCSPETIAKLSGAIAATEANMGGTEMAAALKSTFALKYENEEIPPVILLITDGDVWDITNILSEARKSGHRIFAIGVGSAPAESLLREMAVQTGGACEFVTPKEDITEAIARMFQRMRGAAAKNIHINWGQTPLWQSLMPRFIYDNETVHTFALLSQKPESAPILSWEIGGKIYTDQTQNIEITANEDLLRLGRMRQLEETDSKLEKLSLALRYQLLCDLTSLILVYEREETDKLASLPKIQHIPQMPASGHGCYNRFSIKKLVVKNFVSSEILECPCFLDRGESTCFYLTDENYEEEAKANKWKPTNFRILKLLSQVWKTYLYKLDFFGVFIALISDESYFDDLEAYIKSIVQKTGFPEDNVWGTFIYWMLARENNSIDRHSMRLLQEYVGNDAEKHVLSNEFNSWLCEIA